MCDWTWSTHQQKVNFKVQQSQSTTVNKSIKPIPSVFIEKLTRARRFQSLRRFFQVQIFDLLQTFSARGSCTTHCTHQDANKYTKRRAAGSSRHLLPCLDSPWTGEEEKKNSSAVTSRTQQPHSTGRQEKVERQERQVRRKRRGAPAGMQVGSDWVFSAW